MQVREDKTSNIMTHYCVLFSIIALSLVLKDSWMVFLSSIWFVQAIGISLKYV